jgi:hypothetical protein
MGIWFLRVLLFATKRFLRLDTIFSRISAVMGVVDKIHP